MRVPKDGAQYKKLRLSVGTQQAVADALGVHWTSIAKREAGTSELRREDALALMFVAEHKEALL